MTKTKPIDKEILHLMQEKSLCVPQVSKLAQRLKLPVSTIHARIKKLEEDGIIGTIGFNEHRQHPQDVP